MKTINYWIKTMLGIFLMMPSLISVPLFIKNLFIKEVGNVAGLHNLSYHWRGWGDGGVTPAVPFYLGLMAIAGALLLSNNKTI